MSWKSTLFRLLTALPRKTHHRIDPSQPRILIVSTTGLGDTLWGTPAVRAIKTYFPSSYLGMLTSPIGTEVFKHSPYIDALFTIKKPALMSCIKVLNTLKREAFDTALIFHISQSPVLPFTVLAGPSVLIGTPAINKGLDGLLTHCVKTPATHEIERRLHLVRALGVEHTTSDMELFFTEEENNSALHHLPDHPYIVGFHPGAKDPFKRWNPKHFVTLGRRLVKEKNAKILITGNCDERDLAYTIAKDIPGAISLAGKLPLRVSAALIEKLNLFITNDTGPMHVAFAMKTPTIALFAPTSSHQCGPYNVPTGRVIQKRRTCIPCLGKQCQDPFCMEQIAPEEVWRCMHA